MLISLLFTAISEDTAKDGGEGEEGGDEETEQGEKIIINNYY